MWGSLRRISNPITDCWLCHLNGIKFSPLLLIHPTIIFFPLYPELCSSGSSLSRDAHTSLSKERTVAQMSGRPSDNWKTGVWIPALANAAWHCVYEQDSSATWSCMKCEWVLIDVRVDGADWQPLLHSCPRQLWLVDFREKCPCVYRKALFKTILLLTICVSAIVMLAPLPLWEILLIFAHFQESVKNIVTKKWQYKPHLSFKKKCDNLSLTMFLCGDDPGHF